MKYTLLIFLLLLTALMFALPVSSNQATQAVTNWTNKWAPRDFTSRTIDKIIPLTDADVIQMYMFQYKDGYVLTSADDAVTPILAYGYNTVVTDYRDNPAFAGFIASKQKEIRTIIDGNADNSITSQSWNSLINNDFTRTDTRDMRSLLTTRWNQGWPYNMYCPVDAAGPNGRVYAGCVATAMGQVMKYWNWPVTGVGSHTYYAMGYGNQTANFGQTTYNWSAMPNSVGSANEEVGRLLYHLGVSVDMNYAPDGSGAQSYDAVDALRQNFRYNTGIVMSSKWSYSDATWNAMLKAELDNSRPLYYHGFGDGGGHAFVCDGYQGTDYFHFNWGWSGSFDGYFYTSDLNPGTPFNDGQGAMFNVYPLNYNISMVQLSIQGNDCNVGDVTTVALNSFPIMPQWNVASFGFDLQYDYENMTFEGIDTAGTMLDGAIVNYTTVQPGVISFTGNNATALAGAGTLIKVNFRPLATGEFGFVLSGCTFNTTQVTSIAQAAITVMAEVTEPQNSVIDLLNAMHVSYNEIATVPITTSFIMPSWDVHTVSFLINYPADKVSWEGYDYADCLAQSATVTINDTPGALSVNLAFAELLYGSGDLIRLKFRAIGNNGSVTLVTLTPVDFYYGTTLVQHLNPGYIVLSPVTANEDETTIQVQEFSIAPNPFGTNARLHLTLAKQNQAAEIGIYNLKGQLVRKIFNSSLKGNSLDLNWDGKDEDMSNVKPGMYLVKVHSGNYNKTLKLLKL